MKYSVRVRDARLEAVHKTIGPSPHCRIYSGAVPADCASAPRGEMLVEIKLPGNWLSAAHKGTKVSSGSWTGNAIASGDATCFRIESEEGCDVQGTAGGRDSDAELKLATKSAELVEGHVVTVETFTLKTGNA